MCTRRCFRIQQRRASSEEAKLLLLGILRAQGEAQQSSSSETDLLPSRHVEPVSLRNSEKVEERVLGEVEFAPARRRRERYDEGTHSVSTTLSGKGPGEARTCGTRLGRVGEKYGPRKGRWPDEQAAWAAADEGVGCSVAA